LPAWPVAAAFKPAADRPTLLMFVHPGCPCSQASLAELRDLMAACGNRLAAQVLFFRPDNQSEEWAHTGLWDDARAISGVQVRTDTGGHLAELFGARTSGQVLIYSPSGRLLFSGGITDGRGHVGDNAGLDAAIAAARGELPAGAGVVTANVYGCEIGGPSQAVSCPADYSAGRQKP
jgi:hypothetical protein